VSAVHLFSNTYPTPCIPLAGFESINAGNDVGGSFDIQLAVVAGVAALNSMTRVDSIPLTLWSIMSRLP